MKKLLAGLAFAAVLGGALCCAGPAAGAQTYDSYQISMGGSFASFCLNDESWASYAGAPVVIWDCQAGNKSEEWGVNSKGEIYPFSATGDVLALVNGKAVLEPEGYAGAAWQMQPDWTLGDAAGQYLNDPGWSKANGTQQIAWTHSATANAQYNMPLNAYAGSYTGATYYGASGASYPGSYTVSNCQQGGSLEPGGAYQLVNGQCENSTGSMGLDDNGQGACGGNYNDLAIPGIPGNVLTWAEDGSGGNINNGVLGSLPCGTKIEIVYHGITVVAEKGDISAGGTGSDGSRALDMWWQTAKALCFSNQPDGMFIRIVPQSTPATTGTAYGASDPSTYSTCG